jgi:predicted kinase
MIKQTIYITSGVSGSGKSTYIKNHNLHSVSSDEIVEDYAKENGFNYTEAFDEIQSRKLFGAINSIFFDNIIHNIKSGNDFVIDRTSLNAFTRKSLVELIRTNGDIEIVVVYFDIPKETIIKRLRDREAKTGKGIPDFVIKKQFESFTRPTIDEGYDILETVQ